MAPTTKTSYSIPARGTIPSHGRRIQRLTEISASGEALSVESAAGAMRRILKVVLRYSALDTGSTVAIVVRSGAGEDFDHTLLSHETDNEQEIIYIPDHEMFLQDDDVLEVSMPAVSGKTAAVLIELEAFGSLET